MMNIKNLLYWVFTSGEQGIHGLDWGVKHASEYFDDRQKLDSDYRALLRGFGLPPSLERPVNVNEAGLVLLSWDRSSFIAGFIFSSTDHGSRPNTSSVMFVIPYELAGVKPVNEIIKSVWEKNNIPEIARKNSQNRPDTLRLEGDNIANETAPCFIESISWPRRNKGFIQVDGRLRELSRVDDIIEPEIKESKSESSRLSLKFAAVFAAVIIAGALYFVMSPKPVTSDPPKEVSQDIHESESKPESISESKLIDTPAPEASGVKDDNNALINELREKINQLLGTNPKIMDVKKRAFTVRVRAKDFNEELFTQLRGLTEGRISLEKSKARLVTFKLSEPVSDDAEIHECIEAFLKYFIK